MLGARTTAFLAVAVRCRTFYAAKEIPMTHPWHDISPGEKLPREFEAVIEIPLHANIKYELDKKSGMIRMDRVLYSAVFYPATTASSPSRSPKTTIRSTFSSSARNRLSRSQSCTRAPLA